MTADRPLITVITACLNSARCLEQALASVRNQTYRNVEHIVIDGGSKDGTVEILRKHADELAYWVSEPDRGIGDAWNKGLAKARGEIIGTLNADDAYEARTLEIVAKRLLPSDRALTYGIARIYKQDPEKDYVLYDQGFDPASICYGFGFVHTTCFVPKRVYEEVGLFSTRYRIAVDTDFLLRCYRKGIEFRKIDNLTFMRDGGLSQANPTKGYLEYMIQLYRLGFPKIGIARALWNHFRHRSLTALKAHL